MSTARAIRVSDWRIPVIAASVLLVAVTGCGERTCVEPDTPFTQVTLTWPPDHSVIEDTVSVRVALSDSEMVSRVQLLADSVVLREDSIPPYDFNWDASAYPVGSTHALRARAFDARSRCVSSDTLTVHSQWLAIAEDDDDPWLGDLTRTYVRSSPTVLEFRIEMDCASDECIRDSGVWVLLDTDQDSTTGCSACGNWFRLAPNDIGVEFGGSCGWLFAWADSGCDLTDAFRIMLPRFVFIEPNIMELAFTLADIGNPTVTDIVITSESAYGPWERFDVVPNPEKGHITYVIDGLYIGH